MSILIAVPTFETIMPETFKSIYGLRASKYGPMFDYVRGYDCATARNAIAKEAIEYSFDYVLMIDSDVVVPNNTLDLMLEPGADIVLGLCPRKNTNIGRVEIYKDTCPDYTDFYTYKTLPDKHRLEIKGGGLACALIRTDVFRKLEYPYFRYVEYANGSSLSEDLFFCGKAREAGYQIYADTRVRCGHAARYIQYE